MNKQLIYGMIAALCCVNLTLTQTTACSQTTDNAVHQTTLKTFGQQYSHPWVWPLNHVPNQWDHEGLQLWKSQLQSENSGAQTYEAPVKSFQTNNTIRESQYSEQRLNVQAQPHHTEYQLGPSHELQVQSNQHLQNQQNLFVGPGQEIRQQAVQGPELNLQTRPLQQQFQISPQELQFQPIEQVETQQLPITSPVQQDRQQAVQAQDLNHAAQSIQTENEIVQTHELQEQSGRETMTITVNDEIPTLTTTETPTALQLQTQHQQTQQIQQLVTTESQQIEPVVEAGSLHSEPLPLENPQRLSIWEELPESNYEAGLYANEVEIQESNVAGSSKFERKANNTEETIITTPGKVALTPVVKQRAHNRTQSAQRTAKRRSANKRNAEAAFPWWWMIIPVMWLPLLGWYAWRGFGFDKSHNRQVNHQEVANGKLEVLDETQLGFDSRRNIKPQIDIAQADLNSQVSVKRRVANDSKSLNVVASEDASDQIVTISQNAKSQNQPVELKLAANEQTSILQEEAILKAQTQPNVSRKSEELKNETCVLSGHEKLSNSEFTILSDNDRNQAEDLSENCVLSFNNKSDVNAQNQNGEAIEQYGFDNQSHQDQRPEKVRLEEQKLEAQRLEEQRLEKVRLEEQKLEAQQLEEKRLEEVRLEGQKLEKKQLQEQRFQGPQQQSRCEEQCQCQGDSCQSPEKCNKQSKEVCIQACEQESGICTSSDNKATSFGSEAANKVRRRDDLMQIHGIGKATAKVLRKSGIESFEQLHLTSTESLRQILAKAGPRFKLIDPSDWSYQAALALNGDFSFKQAKQQKPAAENGIQKRIQPTSFKPDILTQIRGIGPATQKILRQKGIHRFEQIANMNPLQLSEMFKDQQGRFQLLDPATWPQQAKTLFQAQNHKVDYDLQLEKNLLNDVEQLTDLKEEFSSNDQQPVDLQYVGNKLQ